jgi:hypothetical protein
MRVSPIVVDYKTGVDLVVTAKGVHRVRVRVASDMAVGAKHRYIVSFV